MSFKKVKSNLTIIVTSAILAIVFPITLFAEENSIEPETIGDYTIVTEEEEAQIEVTNEVNNSFDKTYIGEPEITLPSSEQLSKSGGPAEIPPYYEAPAYPDGTTSISNYAYSNGTLIKQDTEEGILNNIWSKGMYVAGYIFKTVGGLVIDAADAALTTIDKSRGSTVYTYKSYRYIGKDVKVYDHPSWIKWYEAKSRQNFAHSLSTWVNTAGYTKTKSIDYDYDSGFNPVKTEFSTNYNNSSVLKNRAWTNWYKDYRYYKYPEYGY